MYFGLPNQDPILNPKPPFSDRTLNTAISAVQTLDADGKYTQEIFLDGSYSIQIDDTDDVLWDEAPEIFGTDPLSALLTSVPAIATIAEAKALTTLADGQSLFIQGHTAAGDWVGYTFRYDSGSSTTANNVTVYALDSLAGRLLYDSDSIHIELAGPTVTETTLISAIGAVTGAIRMPDIYTLTVATSNADTILSAINRLAVTGSLTLTFDNTTGTMTDSIDIETPYAVNISIFGADTTDTSISSVGTVTGSSKAYSVPLTVASTTGFRVGGWASVRPVTLTGTGNGLFKEYAGFWKITGIAGSIITVTNTSLRASWVAPTLTGGTLTSVPTVLKWPTGRRGIGLMCTLRELSNIVLEGGWDISAQSGGNDTSNDGLQIGTDANQSETGSSVSHSLITGSLYSNDLGVCNWDSNGVSMQGGGFRGDNISTTGCGHRGFQVSNNGDAVSKAGAYSGNWNSGAESESGGMANLNNSVACGNGVQGFFTINGHMIGGYASGNTTNGIDCRDGGVMLVNDADAGAVDNGTSGISCTGGFISCALAQVKDNPTGFTWVQGGIIDAASVDSSGNTTEFVNDFTGWLKTASDGIRPREAVQLLDTNSVPGTNATGGSLFYDDPDLKFKDSSGVVTTITRT